MPTRSGSQRVGDIGEAIVHSIIDRHRNWIARHQSKDYGIDLEAEYAPTSGGNQIAQGKIIKIQCKAQHKRQVRNGVVAVRIDRHFLDYASNFKVPVILAAVCVSSQRVWWIWVQEWLLFNDDRLREGSSKTVRIDIPVQEGLEIGLLMKLPSIARGAAENSMVIALRDLFTSAICWGDHDVADDLFRALGRMKGENAAWIIRRITDDLLAISDGASFAEASQFLPGLLALARNAGGLFTQEQVLRLVARSGGWSKTGFTVLSVLYSTWRDRMIALGLPAALTAAGQRAVAWYAAMRERYPDLDDDVFGRRLRQKADLRYGGLELLFTPEVDNWIDRKWMDRGDAVLVECLTEIPEASV